MDAAAGQFDGGPHPLGWGMAKFWAMTAAEQGVSAFDEGALLRFTERAQRGEVAYDRDALDASMSMRLVSLHRPRR